MIEIIRPYIGEIVVGAAMGFIGWFFERKRKQVEVKNLAVEGNKMEADYSKSIMDMYQEALTDLKNRYEERYSFLKNEYDLKFENLNLQLDKMKRDQEMWKNKYTSLKKEFDVYKQKHP